MTELKQAPSGVSILINHQVKPQAMAAYEGWLTDIIRASAQFDGQQGVTIIKPGKGQHQYEIVVRFASENAAESWLKSEVRHHLITQVAPLLVLPENVKISSGIDHWFEPLNSVTPHPVRWKQWLVTTTVICILTMLIPPVLQLIFDWLPLPGYWGIRHFVSAAVIVWLVIYLVMPRLVPLLAGWLFQQRS